MGKYAGSMRTRALSGAETIHVNGEVLEYLIQGNQHGYCAVHTPYEICRTGARILSTSNRQLHLLILYLLVAIGISKTYTCKQKSYRAATVRYQNKTDVIMFVFICSMQ